MTCQRIVDRVLAVVLPSVFFCVCFFFHSLPLNLSAVLQDGFVQLRQTNKSKLHAETLLPSSFFNAT